MKVYDTTNYSVVANLDYPSAITSMGLSVSAVFCLHYIGNCGCPKEFMKADFDAHFILNMYQNFVSLYVSLKQGLRPGKRSCSCKLYR